MTIAVGILIGLLGVVAIVVGLAIFIMFRIGIRVFDRSLKSDVAAQGGEQVERAAMKIGNPLVRRFVLDHLVKTGGAIAVSVVRGALQSRMRTGLWIAVAGAVAFVASFFTGRWLPLIWSGA
jgi:hypothetical protein